MEEKSRALAKALGSLEEHKALLRGQTDRVTELEKVVSESSSRPSKDIIAEYKQSPEYAEEIRALQQTIAEQIVMSSQYREKSEQKFRAGFVAMQEVCAQHFPDLDFSIFSLIRREEGSAPMIIIDIPEGDETSENPPQADKPSLGEVGDAQETGKV